MELRRRDTRSLSWRIVGSLPDWSQVRAAGIVMVPSFIFDVGYLAVRFDVVTLVALLAWTAGLFVVLWFYFFVTNFRGPRWYFTPRGRGLP